MAVGFKPTLVGPYDFRQLSANVPLLMTVAVGATVDSSAGLVTNQLLNASEEFALDVNRYPRFDFGAAVEVPLPIVSPFVEYGFALPLGVSALSGPDGSTVTPTAAMHQALGVGLKVTAVKDLTLLAAVNIGLARLVGLGVPATPPWNLAFGASFAIDPFQRGEIKFVDTIRERKRPGNSVEGVVTDATSKKPVIGAIVSLLGAKPSATDASGEYQTLGVKAGRATLEVHREGYKKVEREVVLEEGKPTTVDLALEPEVEKATFAITTTAAKKPVKAAVAFNAEGGEETHLETQEDATAPAVTELPPGRYVVTASAEGFLSQTREVQVTPGATLPVAFDLVPSPKKSLVVFKGDKIDVLQQVHFAPGKATILADSYNLLQQVADAVIKNNVKHLKVEGHTDNRGDKAANQALSEARARAVADFLVAQGFERQRVESVGYGDARPIAPNLTARGRELNRRVEFIVGER
jgi:OmpA-OmpF porin, OOP family